MGQTAQALETLKRGYAIDSSNSEIKRLLGEMRKETSQASAGAAKSIPPSVSKELQELEPQYKNVHRELDQIGMKLQAFARDRKRNELTRQDIVDLPENTTMYRSIGMYALSTLLKLSNCSLNIYDLLGKMFLQMTQNQTQTHLREQDKSIQDQVAELESRKTYLERQKTSLEQNINELLAQCQ